jgi:phosphatidylinositol glycan class V
VVLYRLVLLLLVPQHSLHSKATLPASARRNLAFLSAALHVLSPAGVFLSAPYAEASFSLFSFLGCYCYVSSWLVRRSDSSSSDDLWKKKSAGRTHQRSLSLAGSGLINWILVDFWTVGAGICFGVATLLRSNGIFYGMIFAYDALLWAADIAMQIFHGWTIMAAVASVSAVIAAGMSYWIASDFPSEVRIGLALLLLLSGWLLHRRISWIGDLEKVLKMDLDRRRPASIAVTIIAGICNGAGFIYPQFLAYDEFCTAGSDAVVPWCYDIPPSIYTSIQSRYW